MSKIIHGPPEIDNLTSGTKSLGEFFLNLFKSQGDKPLVINGITNEATTASEIVIQSVRVAESFIHLGIRSGDRVGICTENRVENCYILFGTYFIGATLVPISSDYGESELTHMLALTKPKIILVSQKTNDIVKKVNADQSFNLDIINFDQKNGDDSFESFLNKTNVPSLGDQFVCEPQNIKENVAVIIWSSGTTGLPKGVELTQFSIFSNIGIIFQGGNSHILIPSPLSYVSGFMTLMSAIGNGVKVVLLPKFEPQLFLKSIEKYNVEGLFFNPALMYMAAKSPIIDSFDLSSVKFIYYGAAPVSNEIVKLVAKRLKNVKIYQFFAMTESCSLTLQNDEFNTLGSLGVLRHSASGKVIDPTTGKLLGPNEHGELLFKSNRQMKGYTANPTATQDAFDAEGFLHTGDIGYYNERHEWFIVDRLKELIKYYGNTISPAAIEAVLVAHPSVKDACVVGLPDDQAIELPIAFVVKGGDVTEKQLIDYISERMSDPHQLRGGVIFVDEIPKNNSGSGKSFRRVLKEMALAHKKKI